MLSRRETEELIERYCQGILTPEELRIFEQWKDSDTELQQAIDQHKTIISSFDVYARRRELKKKISHIHDQMETEQYRFQSPLKLVKEPGAKGNVVPLWRRYKMATVAAAVAVLAVSATILTFNLAGVSGNKQQSAYQELRRDVESIKRNQKAIIRDISEKQSPGSESVRTYTGTGFAIDPSGYVMTSYHVISDAKSITVSNEKIQSLNMKIVYSNPELDLAVLKVDQDSFGSFGEIPFSVRRSVADPGEKVYTLGFPREDLVFGEGSISSYTGFEGDTAAYQISIPVNPGNSGGPLFDNQGNLIGIISGRNTSAEGASFAVKLRWIANDLNSNSSEKINLPVRKNLRSVDRASQVKRIKDFVFVVKVTN
jgi:S1-C subfamily serine protease